MGSSPSAGPLTAASLSNAAGGQRSRGAILWHPAGRHRHFGEKMSRRSGPGRQGAHRAEHAATQKAAASLGGMNVLRSCFPPEPASASEVPSCLQAVVREVRLQQRTTTQGVARTTSRCHIPANSMTTIRVTGRQKPACHLLASPLAQPLPSGLLMVPTLISSDPYSRFVRVANLSDEDVLLPSRTPVAVLQAIDSVDSSDIQFTVGVSELVVSRETVCRSADSAPADHVPCPDFDGTSSQRKRLQELLTKHAAGFIKDKQDLGYTEAVHHRLRTTDSN